MLSRTFFTLSISAIYFLVPNTVSAAEASIEEIFIIGSRLEVQELPGSGALVDNEQILAEAAGDINQLLKTVPGVYIQEEDGYGLRPNIGIRGATSERSSKITLMEDGVMIAPAPYSNPSAYYFPTALRMHTIELLKGAPLLRYGPHTTGGVLNLVSTPIPQEIGGYVRGGLGEDSQFDVLANYGGKSDAFGFLLETVQRGSNGFKEIDRGGDSGYDIQDYMTKFSWTKENQSLFVKAQYSEETSDETYLGLTDRDFRENSSRRYGLSSPDQMQNDHQGYIIRYSVDPSDNLTITTTGYLNKFARDWFKLSGGGKLVNLANEGDAEANGILNGSVDKSSLKYKHNNRSYESRGIAVSFDLDLDAHQLSTGIRAHKDKMDRYQPTDYYDQISGALSYISTTPPSGSNNRLEDAKASTIWIVDEWTANENLKLNMALRYEDVETGRRQYNDPERGDLASVRGNETKIWLPGISLTYNLSDHFQMIGGIHKGFSPLGGGAKDYEKPETSKNFEWGLRYNNNWFGEAIIFYSDFENKAENCSNSHPCSNGELSGSFVTGAAKISGIEAQFGREIELKNNKTMPINLVYTYTNAEIHGTGNTQGFLDGDMLAAIPESSFSLRLGLNTASGWDHYGVVKYIDETCVNVGCNRSDSIYAKNEDLLVIDYVSHFPISDKLAIYLKVENLLDEDSIISRQPDGARPNKKRTASIGMELNF